MNKERLTKLAQHLRTVPSENLLMQDWNCGSASCAVGHACLMPEFNDQGLRLSIRDSHSDLPYPVYGPDDADVVGWYAVYDFFDLHREAALHLFDPEYYALNPTPTEVADRIDYFVEHDGAVNIHGEMV